MPTQYLVKKCTCSVVGVEVHFCFLMPFHERCSPMLLCYPDSEVFRVEKGTTDKQRVRSVRVVSQMRRMRGRLDCQKCKFRYCSCTDVICTLSSLH